MTRVMGPWGNDGGDERRAAGLLTPAELAEIIEQELGDEGDDE